MQAVEFGYISKEELAPPLCDSVGKSCVSDPIPGSIVPYDLKEAVLKPKMKKKTLPLLVNYSNF